MKNYKIVVTGKNGIFDPAGETSKNALRNLGYDGVESLRIGKYVELETQDDVTGAQVEEMCEKLLANPVIEDYRIEVVQP
ncbi:MAG: phosphoribosylformylglycinamidine synthase subunit PurS [Coriobacteriaceae bacterium]|jgi:phosphoribosylformylglycinamidine synthase|nr:phosphoribosylformylglycinamidine synthase subunit PurS [Coriobacteriaceae bacterium]